MPGRTRIALIVDDLTVRQWQADALLQVASDAEFIILNCTNTEFTRRPFRHALYYVLNLLSLRSAITRSAPLPDSLTVIERIDFEAERDGAWQRLPSSVLEALVSRRPEIAIKFGMGLLRIPDELECRILSYHHGDPRSFRGRPAGFYELLAGVPTVGQIVQIISNRLDAGAVVAFAETRAQPHSYRATMAQSYRVSPLLLRAAIRNCLAGTILPIEPKGTNYRLPSNWLVLRFGARLLARKIRRLFYGAFVHKAWEVASARVEADSLERLSGQLVERSRWRIVQRPRKYQFLADPFPHPRDGVLVEALRKSDGQGEIVHFKEKSTQLLCSGEGHFSYPATMNVGDEWYMVPEVSEWTTPRIYRLEGDRCAFVGELEVDGAPRLVDATPFARDGAVYLFGNDIADGTEVLRLWSADSLFSRFTEHPQSPIRVSPAGGRMAGALLELGGHLYRLGQDCSEGYGRRLIVFEILALSRVSYEEVGVGELSLESVNGPHTLNVRGGTAVFDFYRERFSPLAGVRRVMAAAAKRQARRRFLHDVNPT